MVITNESTDRFKKSEAIEKAILKKTGRLMGFAKAHDRLHALCSALQRSAALCSALERSAALCAHSAARSARAPHALCTPLFALCTLFCTRPQAAGVPMLVLCATAKDSFRKPATGAWDYLVAEANGGVRPQLSESFYVSTPRPL